MVTEVDVFWKAALLTVVIFSMGILVGYWLDTMRVEEIRSEYKEMDLGWGDARLQALYYQIFKNTSNFCEPAINQNLEFADRVYAEGIKLGQYEKINKFTPDLIIEKKRYVLLKLQFWLNCIHLKRLCDTPYINVVYFYSHHNLTIEDQVQGAVLLDLKEGCGRKMMLIPLPIDLNLTTTNMIKEQYNIKKTPTILIDEEIKLEGLQTRDELMKYLSC